jgi:hypothetical protein
VRCGRRVAMVDRSRRAVQHRFVRGAEHGGPGGPPPRVWRIGLERPSGRSTTTVTGLSGAGASRRPRIQVGHGSEYVFTVVKLRIASWTPSL